MRPIDRLRSAANSRRRGADGSGRLRDPIEHVTELAGLDALDRPLAAHPGLAGERGTGCGRSWPPSASRVLAWQLVVWSGWKPEYALPGPVAVFGTLVEEVNEAGLQEAILITLRRGVDRLHPGVPDRGPAGPRRGAFQAPAHRHRCPHLGHPDHALDRLVPARHPPLPADRTGDPLRGHPGCGAVDRQRPHLGRRPDPARPAASRERHGRPRHRLLPPRPAAGRPAVLRGRA